MYGVKLSELNLECDRKVQMVMECDKGWTEIVRGCLRELQALKGNSDVNVVQIKEKWGELRVYLDRHSEASNKIIEKYEKKAAKTCEMCGKPGTLRDDIGWIRTLCNEHYGKTIDARAQSKKSTD